MAKKGCIVRIYAGGLFSSGRDLYVVSGQDGALIEVIVTPPSDGGPVTAAGYDFHDAVDLEVTKSTYKRYLAHAKKNPASTRGKMPPADLPPPIPGMEGPFRYKTGFILYWDPREGKYYDRGKDVYLSIQEAEAAMGTKNPTRNSGYQLSSKQKKALDTYFAPSRERGEVPPDGKYTMEDLGIFWDDMDEHGLRAVRDAIDAYAAAPIPNKGPLRRRTATRDWIGKAITRPGKLGGAGFLSKSKAAQEKILRGCVTEYGYRSCLGSVMILERIPDIQNRWGARLAGLRHFLVRNFGGPGSFGPRGNPGDDFALVPEVAGCSLCAVKSNPAFTKAMANPLYGMTAPQEAVYMHLANLDVSPAQGLRQAKAMTDRQALAFMAHVKSLMGDVQVSTRRGARGTARRKVTKKAPRKKAKKNVSAVLRNAMRGT